MHAIGFDAYGGPDVLRPVVLPDPHPGPGEVRVRVAAAGVAPVDAMERTGRLAALNKGLTPPFVPGMEVAGVIDEVGPGGEAALPIGTPVVAFVDFRGSWGGYSDLVVPPVASVTPAPARASMPEAASFLMNSLTAQNGLDALGLAPGDTLLVPGAAGAVGGYVTQLASRAGLRVVALAGEADEELVRSFGAELFVPRGPDAVERVRALVPGGVDAAADPAGIGSAILGAIRDGGQLAVFRPQPPECERGITGHGLNVRRRATDHAAIARLGALAADGVLAMRVAHVLPAAEAPEAHRLLDAGGLRGRIILEFPVRPARHH